jgi:hypothetical protein
VQFGELLLMSATVGAPPFAEIETDTAEFEMYFGVRAAAADAGCEIVSTSFPATRALADGVLGALAPPPPHAASDKAPIRKDPARRRCIDPLRRFAQHPSRAWPRALRLKPDKARSFSHR